MSDITAKPQTNIPFRKWIRSNVWPVMAFGVTDISITATPITRGVDLNALIGNEFEVQGVRFRGTEECRPCYWMDQAFAPGAEKFLKGQGGLRATILTDGTLRVAHFSAKR
jgi:hypothetical protein